MKSFVTPLLYIITFIAGAVVWSFVTERFLPFHVHNIVETGKQIRSGGYTYINPLIECEVDHDGTGNAEYTAIEESIGEYVSQQVSQKNLIEAGVYFRDLNNGPTLSINSSINFSPASLLKLPVMMAYFRLAEEDASILKKDVLYESQISSMQQEFSTSALQKGKSYTIDELIMQMITKSDNEALGLLGEQIDISLIHKVTEDLGMTTPKDPYAENFMTVKQYASLFRVLYNASYLDREYSEKSLTILSKTNFTKGLVAGLPKGAKIAHKYGEREIENGVDQLHDCGIIYTNKPYLLCVMTRGDNPDTLASIIQTISKKVYDGVKK